MKRVLALILVMLIMCSCSGRNAVYESIPFDQNDHVIWAIQPALSSRQEISRSSALDELYNKVYLSNGLVLFSEKRDYISYTGVSDRMGNIILSANYYNCGYLPYDNLLLNSDSAAILLNRSGKKLVLKSKDWTNSLYGLSTNDAYPASDDTLYFPMRDMVSGKSFFMNSCGEIMFDQFFDETRPFSEGLAAVKINDKFGYIDLDGNMVISPWYSEAQSFYDGVAVVQKDTTYITIDKAGNELFSGDWETLSPFINGMSIFSKNGCYGVITLEGDLLLQPEFDSISRYKTNFVVKKGRRIGVFDPSRDTFVGYYDEVSPIDTDFAITKDAGKYGLLNLSTCNETIPTSLFLLEYLGEGMLFASKDGKSAGFIDKKGNWLIEYNDSLIIPADSKFERGLLSVQYKGKWGVISNPLLYTSWVEDELNRAQFIGINKSAKSTITMQEAADIVETVGNYRQVLSERLILSAKSDVPVSSKALLEGYGKSDSPVATRADAAYLFYTLAKMQNEITENYVNLFSDVSNCSSIEKSAIAYTMSLNIFDCNAESFFEPDLPVTETEMVTAAVRFVEGTIDSEPDNCFLDMRIFDKYLN